MLSSQQKSPFGLTTKTNRMQQQLLAERRIPVEALAHQKTHTIFLRRHSCTLFFGVKALHPSECFACSGHAASQSHNLTPAPDTEQNVVGGERGRGGY